MDATEGLSYPNPNEGSGRPRSDRQRNGRPRNDRQQSDRERGSRERSAKFPRFNAVRVSIRSKILIVFLASFSVYIILVTILSWRIMDGSTQQQLSQGTNQASDLLISGIQQTLDHARKISYNLLQNADIMAWLGDDGGSSNISATRNANRVLIQTYVTFSGIESIYLFNNAGEGVNASHHLPIQLFGDISATAWYRRAVDRRGGFFLTLNADGTLFSTSGKNNISLIRQVLDINTMLPIGYLIVNLNESFIADTIMDINKKHGTSFYVLDENGESVLREQELPSSWGGHIPPGGVRRRIDGERLFLSKTDIPKLGWTVISAMPNSTPLPFSSQVIILPVLCAVGMYLFGSVFTANLISKPVNELISSMQGVREGRFEPVPPNERQDEFGQLNKNYNIMIDALKTMISQRILLEKEKQRYELDVLTEQFKPHFLYNTLESISYLVMSGDNKKACDTIVALSRFYRASLNKGLETSPLDQEVELIKNYLALQKTRYGELFEDYYDIHPDAGKAPVLRNILQPLVENSIYHGIKPSGEPGIIAVRAYLDGGMIKIYVEDDGMGMAPDKLDAINAHIADRSALSFGLRGTIKRLQLFYGYDDIYELESAPGKGTAILLKIPCSSSSSSSSLSPSTSLSSSSISSSRPGSIDG